MFKDLKVRIINLLNFSEDLMFLICFWVPFFSNFCKENDTKLDTIYSFEFNEKYVKMDAFANIVKTSWISDKFIRLASFLTLDVAVKVWKYPRFRTDLYDLAEPLQNNMQALAVKINSLNR